MRVLHCIPGMGGGGAERQLTYLAAALKELGCEVHVALSAGGANLDRLRLSGAEIHRLVGRGNHDPRLFLQLRALIRKLGPRVIHTWLVQMDILGGLATWEAGIPWVLSERSSGACYPRSPKNRVREILASKASAIVSNSVGGDRYWAGFAGPAIPRWVIPNGLPLAEIDAMAPVRRETHGLPENVPVILFAGRFSVEKNVLGFLEAVRRMPGELVAVLCGDGPQLAEVREIGGALLNRVHLVGYTSELWGWLKLADVVVSPSHFEGHPNVVMEAMASKCALVVSDIPAHRALLDDSTAEFVDPGDADTIVRGIHNVLRDRDRTNLRIRSAREVVEAFDIRETASRFVSVYHEITSNVAISKAS